MVDEHEEAAAAAAAMATLWQRDPETAAGIQQRVELARAALAGSITAREAFVVTLRDPYPNATPEARAASTAAACAAYAAARPARGVGGDAGNRTHEWNSAPTRSIPADKWVEETRC